MRENSITAANKIREDWAQAKCDKYDYLIAAFCGGAAGLLDVLFVGSPMNSVLGKSSDKIADSFVQKTAQIFWKFDLRPEKNKKIPTTLEQSISYLEQAFPVNYDARYAKDLMVEDTVLKNMRPMNHHLLSLAHSPDIIGLIFSIINQFMGYASFVDKGKIINVIPVTTSKAIPYLQGRDTKSMIFCGFVNWIGHLMSDVAGSSSTRRLGKKGRGAGIPIPFYELFLGCNFGDFEGKTFAETMIRVFEEGYDLRFGGAMAFPIVLEELMIRVIWSIRQKFIRKKNWKDSYPSKLHADLRIMLIVGNATFCAIDGGDAIVHGLMSGNNMVCFICHLNLVGWVRLIILVMQELVFRYGSVVVQAMNYFVQSMFEITTPTEQQCIAAFRREIAQCDRYYESIFRKFVLQVEKEYQEMNKEIEDTFDKNATSTSRVEHSIKIAEHSNVPEKKIIRTHQDLDEWFSVK